MTVSRWRSLDDREELLRAESPGAIPLGVQRQKPESLSIVAEMRAMYESEAAADQALITNLRKRLSECQWKLRAANAELRAATTELERIRPLVGVPPLVLSTAFDEYVTLHASSNLLEFGEKRVELTTAQALVLRALLAQPGLRSSKAIEDQAGLGNNPHPGNRIRSQVHRLKLKLATGGLNLSDLVKTVRGTRRGVDSGYEALVGVKVVDEAS